MVAPATIVRLLWNGARAVGAARAATTATSRRDLARRILQGAHRLWKANQQLQDASTDEEAAEVLNQIGVSYGVDGEEFTCESSRDFL